MCPKIGPRPIYTQIKLSSHEACYFVVFLDIAKAYDTVHRGFLKQILRAMGVGDDFVDWVSWLLTQTSARAEVNGFLSGLHEFPAGVRQGCPLSPLLYLFVSEALLRFIKAHPALQVTVDSLTLSAQAFADDTHVFLDSLDHVPALLAHLDVFKQASGQAVHPGKSSLLPIGYFPDDIPPHPQTGM
jgi:hypothetical protein